MNSAKRQGETIQSLERVGGHVYYDYEFDESGCLPTVAEPAVPSWLLRLFGRDQFATVVLAAVEGEAGLDYVRDLHDLQILRIGSADFPPLLPWAKNAPATLLVLRGRNRYYGGESTGPHYPKLNPESLEHLGALADLRRLELSGFWIDRAGLDALASLRQLRRLSLSDMLLEDEDRQEIIDLNQPSDFGLESLERLTQLQELDLGSIHLTDSGKERLQRALPNCRIERW
jgi:hypothetical protein